MKNYKLSRLLASIVMDISTVQWRKECRLGHRYGRCMCSRQFGDWRELRRPDQKRHYVTIALRRWSVTKTWTCRNLTMKNDDFEAVDFVQAIHISEDCHGLFLAALVIVCAITQTADDIDARTSHRVAPSTRIPDAECGIETQKNCIYDTRPWKKEKNHVEDLPLKSGAGTHERRCSFALDRGGNLDRE
ncbi:hypothetical protein KCU75_g18, partial [Aureobasidium melanogenum]